MGEGTSDTVRPDSAARREYPLAILRGVGRVEFFANPWTGLIFVIALFAGGRQFGVFGLLGFTAPFCVITTVMAIGAPSFERVWSGHTAAAVPNEVPTGTSLSWSDAWHGLFNGIGQVFLQDEWYVGLIFQAVAVVVVALYTFVVTFIIGKVVDGLFRMRQTEEEQIAGADVSFAEE